MKPDSAIAGVVLQAEPMCKKCLLHEFPGLSDDIKIINKMHHFLVYQHIEDCRESMAGYKEQKYIELNEELHR